MSLDLAIKRVYRFFDPSPRRWLRRNYFLIGSYLIGLFTGLLASGHSSPYLPWYFCATMAIMLGLKWWSGAGRDASEMGNLQHKHMGRHATNGAPRGS